MNITFLIGNGFDIGLGLNTGYESFYKEYCGHHGNESSNIYAFKEYLSRRQDEEIKRIIDWSDFEIAFGQHSLEFKENEKDAYLERFEDFVMCFNDYIEKKEKQIDYSDANSIGKMMKTAVTTYFDIRPADKAVIQAIYDRNPSNSRVYNFVTFNYTHTIDECAKKLEAAIQSEANRNVGKVLHIHGYIEDTMIMGVNDPSQIANPEFANDDRIIREIVKPRQNADAKMDYEKNVIQVIDSSDIICIYGMSLGDTDKKWWVRIAEWLSKSDKRALVILKYDTQCNRRFPFHMQKAIDKVTNRFLSFSELDDAKNATIAQRVFVGMNHNVFGMKLYKEERIKKGMPIGVLDLTKSIQADAIPAHIEVPISPIVDPDILDLKINM